VIEQSEYNLYRIAQEFAEQHPDLELHACLGDAGDSATLDRVLAQGRPDVMFHAAAYKHVPLLEQQLREAYRNNVLATQAAALAADRYGVESFVLISTDKAVNPANVMGCEQARGRGVLPEPRGALAHALHHGALRQRAGFGRQRRCRCSASRSRAAGRSP
jgi:FlaA1/EpsC-like NDP-sugar epimerase